jgi:hypothetical protein
VSAQASARERGVFVENQQRQRLLRYVGAAARARIQSTPRTRRAAVHQTQSQSGRNKRAERKQETKASESVLRGIRRTAFEHSSGRTHGSVNGHSPCSRMRAMRRAFAGLRLAHSKKSKTKQKKRPDIQQKKQRGMGATQGGEWKGGEWSGGEGGRGVVCSIVKHFDPRIRAARASHRTRGQSEGGRGEEETCEPNGEQRPHWGERRANLQTAHEMRRRKQNKNRGKRVSL